MKKNLTNLWEKAILQIQKKEIGNYITKKGLIYVWKQTKLPGGKKRANFCNKLGRNKLA